MNRIEKERRAVLAEAQMMNTIEYRVDCQLLQYLHEENALGSRFPIGKTDQVWLQCVLDSISASRTCLFRSSWLNVHIWVCRWKSGIGRH